MVGKKRDRRFPVALPIAKEIRLSLWAFTRGVSKTRMAEAILIDRVSNAANWSEVCKDLKIEAEVRQIPVEDLIKEVLRGDGFEGDVSIDKVNWGVLLDNEEPDLEDSEL